MAATKTRKKSRIQHPLPPDVERNGDVHLDFFFIIPPSATTLHGFREWSSSDTFPERGRITFASGEIIVDMSPERIGSHHAVRRVVSQALGLLADEGDSGEFYLDGVRLVNVPADVSNEPDGMYALWESFESGRIREIKTADEKDWIELEGTPDWIMEIVSPSSVKKDTVKLRERYHHARIPEFWLIDVRGDKLDFVILLWHTDGYQPAPSRGGWQKSRIFGKQFRLIRLTNRRGRPAYRLEMK
jgi:Uma2 family endonuclease